MNKIAILGSGKSAKNFVKAINKSSKFKLIQIGSRNLQAANQISSICNSHVQIKSINKVIKSKANNTVIVCLPGYLQPSIIKNLLFYNKNIICEKPFALKYNEAKKIFNIWQKIKKFVW